MLYILSPTKTMKTNSIHQAKSLPQFHKEAGRILEVLRTLDKDSLRTLMKIQEPLAIQNIERYQRMRFDMEGTCAIDAYNGLQFQSMKIATMQSDEIAYLQEHLRILSGFYGVVRPLDALYPYRLEMQCKLAVDGEQNLYGYWKDQLANTLRQEVQTHRDPHILNLASKEYEKAVRPYVLKEQWVDVIFQVEKNGKRRVEATRAKMARGSMVHWLCEQRVETLEEVSLFHEDGYRLDEEQTGKQRLVFYKRCENG